MSESVQLHLLRPGQRATITKINGAGALRRRFIEMGIVKGETILIERHAPLGDPKTCPRGNPIPDENGNFTPLSGTILSEVEVGKAVNVLAVNATTTDVLKYLQERNILPGHKLEVVEAAPLKGPLTLRVDGKKEVALGLSMAEFVIVE